MSKTKAHLVLEFECRQCGKVNNCEDYTKYTDDGKFRNQRFEDKVDCSYCGAQNHIYVPW